MGVAITQILTGKPITTKDLKGKKIAIDAYNMLYQFLTVLRGPDGAPLTNSKGEVTSHVQGLFSRNVQFLSDGISPIYVFDGEPPELKKKERERRAEIKKEAQRQYEIAKERNDFEAMRKYSSRMVRVTPEILVSAKKLLNLMGIPYVNAPSEGEAQAGVIVKAGDADYVVSQDADALLFGGPKVIRNLSIQGKRKTSSVGSKIIEPILFVLDETLAELGLTHDQLIVLAILVGTDFNVGGVKGLGPKKSLLKVREFGEDFEKLFDSIETNFDWTEIFDFFKNVPAITDYTLNFGSADIPGLQVWLTEDMGFSADRVTASLKKLEDVNSAKKQQGLSQFF
jgi:flap endonuclease-1